jgi:hypothetical protein
MTEMYIVRMQLVLEKGIGCMNHSLPIENPGLNIMDGKISYLEEVK